MPVTFFNAADCSSLKPPSHKISRNSPVYNNGRAHSKAIPRRSASSFRICRSPKGVAVTNTLAKATAVNADSNTT